MQTVACPHCGHNVQDDGSLGGQLVSCPSCVRNFTMPALAIASQPLVMPMETRRSVRLDVRARGPSFAILMVAVLFIVAVVAIAVLVVGEIRAERDKERAKEAVREIERAFEGLNRAIDGKPPK